MDLSMTNAPQELKIKVKIKLRLKGQKQALEKLGKVGKG